MEESKLPPVYLKRNIANGSSRQPQRTPPFASNPAGGSTAPSPSLPTAPPTSQVEGAANNEKKPDFSDGLDHLDSPQYIERLKKHEEDYSRYLMEKYFRGMSLRRGNIFDQQMIIHDDEVLKSYINPVVGFVEKSSNSGGKGQDSGEEEEQLK